MGEHYTIAIDAMGGDHGLAVTVPACLAALEDHPTLSLVLVGDEVALRDHLQKKGVAESERLTIKHASQHITMDENPAQALRSKRDSSMRVAVNLVHEGHAKACVSAGNTGALMATARFVLRMLPGIDRPAIMARFPTRTGREVRVLDLGANVDSSAENLYQFAVMASVMTAAVDKIEAPKIGLLNIGSEDIKGNEQVKQTAQLLNACSGINYTGYIEADQIFEGGIDVVVCDGFVGNVALKACEGISRLIGGYIREAFHHSFLTKFIGLFAGPVLKRVVATRLDPGKRNGASLIGLRGIVIKSHGGADVNAYKNAIEEAILQAQYNIPALIGEKVGALLGE